MATIEELTERYDLGHEKIVNRIFHILGVIIATIGLLALLWWLPSGLIKSWLGDHPFANWATVYAVLMIIYFGSESFSLTFAGGVFYQACLFGVQWLEGQSVVSFSWVILILFGIGFFLMLIGHMIQGNPKEIGKDIKYLVLSPTWIFRFVYRWIGVPF